MEMVGLKNEFKKRRRRTTTIAQDNECIKHTDTHAAKNEWRWKIYKMCEYNCLLLDLYENVHVSGHIHTPITDGSR